jgi:hypothetical protein
VGRSGTLGGVFDQSCTFKNTARLVFMGMTAPADRFPRIIASNPAEHRLDRPSVWSSVLLRQRVENGFDVIAIIFLPLLVVVVILAFQGPVKIFLDDNAAVESVPHSCRHLLKRDFGGFVPAAQIDGAHEKNQ